MDGGEERSGVFGITSGDPAPAFEMQDSIFDQVTKFV
jgi:hypothetical protein